MSLPSSLAADLLGRFLQQRNQAKQRGIEWDLSYLEWLAIWRGSGHLFERGRHKGSYQMCRFEDVGPYASSNVRIDRMENNIREAKARQKVAGAANGSGMELASPST
jgi:hypothetical protein